MYKYRLPFFLSVALLIIVSTILVIKIASGYRIDFRSKTFEPVGILVLNSIPTGADVVINGELKAATADSLYLNPGRYKVTISKVGYQPWEKELVVEKQLVTEVNTILFPTLPDLKPLTFDGVESAFLSPDGSKIAYISNKSLLNSGGIWLIDNGDSFLGIGRTQKQIAQNSTFYNFTGSSLYWSPDSRQLLAAAPQNRFYLLDTFQNDPQQNILDVSYQLKTIEKQWQQEKILTNETRIKKIPDDLALIIKATVNQEFSPDGSKIRYTATDSATIPDNLIPPVSAASTQTQTRKIQPNRTYVYDLKEDRNFLLPFNQLITPTPVKNAKPSTKVTPTTTFPIKPVNLPSWLSTSRQLFWIDGSQIVACDYDGTNLTTLYNGPFIEPYVFASNNAIRLTILARISTDATTSANLYSVSLK